MELKTKKDGIIKVNVKCWSFYPSDYRVKEFVMNIQLYSPQQKSWIEYHNMLLDTGFDGDILIPMKDFEKHGFLQVLSIESGQWEAESVSGEKFKLISSFSELRIDDYQIEVMVESFTGNNSGILGRGILIRLKTTIDGKNEQTCIEID